MILASQVDWNKKAPHSFNQSRVGFRSGYKFSKILKWSEMAPICKKKWIFWPIFDSSFSYKCAKNENKINLASRTEKACSMNIQSKKSAWFTKYFSCNRDHSFEKNSFEKNAFKSSWESIFDSSYIDSKNATTKKFNFLERTRWKCPLNLA